MHLSQSFGIVLAIVHAVTSAVISPVKRHVSDTDSDDFALEERNPLAVIDTVLTLISLGFGTIEVLSDVFEDHEESEAAFVDQVVAALGSQYPNMNGLVVEKEGDYTIDDQGTLVFSGEVELDLIEFFNIKKKYKVFAFDHGVFDLRSDGGDRNWGNNGCWRRRQDPPTPIHMEFLHKGDIDCVNGVRVDDSRGSLLRPGFPAILALSVVAASFVFVL